jgi:nucleoid DNA-binding protein
MVLPMKKPMKAGPKAMTKTALVQAISAEMGMKSKVCKQVVENLAGIATEQVKSMGKFTLPGLFRIKTRVKPATKAGKRMAFGKEVKVKAKPARTIVKAFAVKALKDSV